MDALQVVHPYSAKREWVAYDITNHSECYEVTYKICKHTYVSHFKEVILYGSCVRRDFTPESDIDVVVLLDAPQDQLREERSKGLGTSRNACVVALLLVLFSSVPTL